MGTKPADATVRFDGWEGTGSRMNHEPEDLPGMGIFQRISRRLASDPLLGFLDHRSLEGWGTGEDEEAGAILRVFPGLGDFLFARVENGFQRRSRFA